MSKNKDIVVIGASAGGVSALQRLVTGLPSDLNAAVFIVLHTPPSSPSLLAPILQRCTSLPVAEAGDGDSVKAGSIVVARPDYHLVLDKKKTVRLTRGPRENHSRPSIDVLFRSAAHSYSGRVIGVILTGSLDDGTAGLWSVRHRGGTAVVQDPDDAVNPSMPRSALQYVAAEYIVPVAEIGQLLGRLTCEQATEEEKAVSKEMKIEIDIASEKRGLEVGVMELGPITPYTCPECHGVLVQLKEGGVPRFRCHTGHAYSINTLLADVTEGVEHAMWNAIRITEESAMLLEQLGEHLGEITKDPAIAHLMARKAKDTKRRADLVRTAAMEHQTLSEENVADVKDKAR